MKTDCPFCTIDKDMTRILWKGKYTIAILSNPSLMKGHILCVPKRHVENISELSAEEQKELLEAVIKFQNKILNNIARGCDLRQHHRPFQQQSKLKVNHLHIHLQPRELFDELYEKCQVFEKEVFKDLTKKEKDEMIKIFSKD